MKAAFAAAAPAGGVSLTVRNSIMAGKFIHGADETLRGVFWDLGQIGDVDGPKYPEPLLRRLAAKILEGRAHEPLAFRLCHLVRCAAFAAEGGGPQGWLEFFCAPGAGRSGWAAGWLRERLPGAEQDAAEGPAVAAAAAVLRYPGRAEPVLLSYGAMPLLAAFMEFLLNALRYDVVRDALAPLSRRDLDWRGLQDAANALSRAIYAWLRLHARPVQESRDFEALARFLATRGEGGDFTEDDIDDDAVLAFWRAASTEPGSGFRTFRKTFRAFLQFADAMGDEALRRGADEPLSLDGGAAEAGYDPADLCSPGLDRMRAPVPAPGLWEGPDDEAASPLERLSGAGVKVLLAGEARRLVLVDAYPRLLPALALSLLRDAVFGRTQGRISQALRTGAAQTPALTRGAPAEGYDDEARALADLLVHLGRVTDAAAYALARAGGEDGVLAGLDRETLGRGRRALDTIRRRGFEEVRAGAPEALTALRQAAPAVIELGQRLAPLCERLAAGAPWAPRQQEDAPVFQEQFSRIYGTAAMREGGTAP